MVRHLSRFLPGFRKKPAFQEVYYGCMWDWLGKFASIVTIWQWVAAWVVAGLAMILAWLEEYSPTVILLAGLTALALVAFALNQIAQYRERKQARKNPPAKADSDILLWKHWQPDHKFRMEIKSLCGEHSNAEITYFDGPHFKFSERLADALRQAGWDVNFNKHPHSQTSPMYHGITIQGPSRTLVEGVGSALRESGLLGVKEEVTKLDKPKGHHKYDLAQNRLNIFIGFEE